MNECVHTRKERGREGKERGQRNGRREQEGVAYFSPKELFIGY